MDGKLSKSQYEENFFSQQLHFFERVHWKDFWLKI